MHPGRRPSALPVAMWLISTSPLTIAAQQPVRDSLQQSRDSLSRDSLPFDFRSLRGALIARLPVDDIRQSLTLIPGVLVRGAAVAPDGATAVSIRGGTVGQASTHVDGAPVRFQLLGTPAIVPPIPGVARVTVTTGVADIVVGDVANGLISYETPQGGTSITAQGRAETDEVFGAGSSVGYHRFSGSAGGPVPGVGALRWFLAGEVQGQSSQYYGMGAEVQPTYVLDGVDTTVQYDTGFEIRSVDVPAFHQWNGDCDGCQGLRRPYDWTTNTRVQGRLDLDLGPRSGASFSGFAAGRQDRYFPANLIGAPSLYQGAHDWSRLLVLNVRHQLGAPLAVRGTLSYGTNKFIGGALTESSELETRDPGLGIEFTPLTLTGLDVWPFPITEQTIRTIRSNVPPRVPYDGRSDLENASSGRTNPFGLGGSAQWFTQGNASSLTLMSEQRLNGRVELAWAPGGPHDLSLGVEAGHTALSLYETAELINVVGINAVIADPRSLGLFLIDRMRLGDVALDAGVRYDSHNPGADLPVLPAYISSHPDWLPTSSTNDADYAASVEAVMDPTRAQGRWSPRLRLTWADDRTRVRAAFGQHVEIPPYETLLAGANSDLSFTDLNAPFGRDVDLGKVTLYEIGIDRSVSDRLAFSVSGYAKTPAIVYGERLEAIDNPRGGTVFVNTLQRLDNGSLLGLDAGFRGRTNILEGLMSYSLAVQKTDNDAVNPSLTAHTLTTALALTVPERWQPSSMLGSIAKGLGATALFRAMSGPYYTLLVNQGDGWIAPGAVGGRVADQGLYESQLAWSLHFDARITKRLQTSGLAWTVYLDVRNLFGFRNTERLFAETGDVVNDEHRREVIGAHGSDFSSATGEYALLWNEAQEAGALSGDRSVNLSACQMWAASWNCLALRQVEQRFGDGNGLYTLAEQDRTLNTYYDSFYGPWFFYGPGRTARLGLELEF